MPTAPRASEAAPETTTAVAADPAAAAPAGQEAGEAPSRMEQALQIAKNRSYWAAGSGLIPLPIFDIAAITAIQLKMIHEIAGVYGTKLTEHLGKSILASLLSGLGTTAASYGAMGTLLKTIPFVGPALGIATLPVTAGAATYAVGAVFATAFETGDASLTDGEVASTREQLADAIANAPS